MAQEDIWAHYQNEATDSFADARSRLSFLLNHAEKYKRPGTLLNIGCGDGYLERSAQKNGWKTYSLDPDQRAMQRLADQGIDAHCGLIERMPFNDQTFDVVTCSEVLEHLRTEQLAASIPEIVRVLKDDGILIGTTPYRENLQDNEFVCEHCGVRSHRWGHHQSFDETRMGSLLSPNFEIQALKPKYFPTWRTNWKGKVINAALLTLSICGSSGKTSTLFFAARRKSHFKAQ